MVNARLKKLTATAQLSAPDLRRPQPTLVDTGEVGDAGAGGLEGAISTALARAKEAYSRSFGANTTGLAAGLEHALDELQASFDAQIERLLQIKILGMTLPLPFADGIKELCGQALEAVRGKERELLAVLTAAGAATL
jgi:hypothetical protein